MSLRYEQQSNNTKTLLTWLKEQPQFAQVLHPSDKAAPGHQYWQEICSTGRSAGLVSVVFKSDYDISAVRRFVMLLSYSNLVLVGEDR